LPLTDTPSSPRRERRDGDGATDALALPPLCLRATLRFKDRFSAMRSKHSIKYAPQPPPLCPSRAQITVKAAASLTSTVWSKSNGLGPASICDHCRGELGHSVHRYWHMQFCSSACMTAYQLRLAPETRVKICQLDVFPWEDQINGSNAPQPPILQRGLWGFWLSPII
jgi:hypothetical protein